MPLLNALAVCLGKNACKIRWTNSLMRSYFISCLDHRKLIMFPAASEQCKVEDEVTKNRNRIAGPKTQITSAHETSILVPGAREEYVSLVFVVLFYKHGCSKWKANRQAVFAAS